MRLALLILVSLFFTATSFALESNNPSQAQKNLMLADSPPGLQKKGISGIPSSGKTPHGWNQGEKRGWNKDKNWHWDNKTQHGKNKTWHRDKHSNGWEGNNRGKMKNH